MHEQNSLLSGKPKFSPRNLIIYILTVVLTFGVTASVLTIGYVLIWVFANKQDAPAMTLTCDLLTDKYSNTWKTLEEQVQFQRETRKEIRNNVFNEFSGKNGIIYMKGSEENEEELLSTYRQDSNFFYVTGVQWPSYHIVMDLDTEEITLYHPKLSPNRAIWNFLKLYSNEEIKDRFGVDFVKYTTDLEIDIKNRKSAVMYTDKLDNPFTPEVIGNTTIDKETLRTVLWSNLRPVKTKNELEYARRAIAISSAAHRRAMAAARVGLKEYNIQALFEQQSIACDARRQAYDPIVGSGQDGSVLHYIANNKELKDGEVLLIDAGAEFHGYSADITRTYPVNGRFTSDQRGIYAAVLAIQKNAIKKIKAGVGWSDIVKGSEMDMLSELYKLNLVNSDDIDAMRAAAVQRLFQPHGLGHYFGLDVHDTISVPYGLELRENVLITVEPGIYFLPFLFEDATDEQKKFLNMEKIETFYKFGGVRIEDDILVTNDGYEILSAVPKEIIDVEAALIQVNNWQP